MQRVERFLSVANDGMCLLTRPDSLFRRQLVLVGRFATLATNWWDKLLLLGVKVALAGVLVGLVD